MYKKNNEIAFGSMQLRWYFLFFWIANQLLSNLKMTDFQIQIVWYDLEKKN